MYSSSAVGKICCCSISLCVSCISS
uniref:Uncharacterized protein n=1 Tax=Arundo donax TaxID=35708 RepID=A0A0A8ZHA6_ARUDO